LDQSPIKLPMPPTRCPFCPSNNFRITNRLLASRTPAARPCAPALLPQRLLVGSPLRDPLRSRWDPPYLAWISPSEPTALSGQGAGKGRSFPGGGGSVSLLEAVRRSRAASRSWSWLWRRRRGGIRWGFVVYGAGTRHGLRWGCGQQR